jgi:hypothetical protein
MDKYLDKIALVTTVSNTLLYNKTIKTFPKNIDLIAIDGSKGLFGINSIKFMFRKLSSKKYNWIIMADEDVLFYNPLGVFNIIDKMKKNDITVCGIRDGGVLSWRGKNPYLINPFFCIIDFDKINLIYNEKEIDENQYIMENEFNDDLSNLPFDYDKNSIFEEYYCFFLWLRRKGMNFYFLDAISNTFENDLETTTVFNINGEPMLYHTWYARTYGKNEWHTNRIDKIINYCNQENIINQKFNVIWYKDYVFNINKDLVFIKSKFKKFILSKRLK